MGAGGWRSLRANPGAWRHMFRVGTTLTVVCCVVAGWVLAGSGYAATKRSSQLVITTVAGGGPSPALSDGPSAAQVQLGSPVVAVYDSHGNIVIADQNNNEIRVVAGSDGTWYGQSMVAGHIYTIVGNGTGTYTGDDDCPNGNCIPLTQVTLNNPNGVAVDANGDIAITDTGNSVVRFVAATAGTYFGSFFQAGEINTIAHSDGTLAQQTGSAAAMNSPDGIAFDAEGDLIVADTGNDVIRLIANGPPGTPHTVYGEQVYPGTIYEIAGNGTMGYTGNGGIGYDAELSLEPLTGVAVDPAGNVAFSDADNEVVRMVAAQSGSYHGMPVTAGDIYTIAGNAVEGYTGDKKPATATELDIPEGVAYDSVGDLFIGDSVNNRIRYVPAVPGVLNGKAVTAGDVYTVAGNGNTGDSGDGGPATSATLNSPAGVATGAAGRLLIADYGNNSIRQVAFPPPSIRAVKPTIGTIDGDRTVHIKGTNLSDATSVMFGSRPALSFRVVSSKRIVATTPPEPAGTVTVRVVTANGTTAWTSGDLYTYSVNPPKHAGAQTVGYRAPVQGANSGSTGAVAGGAGAATGAGTATRAATAAGSTTGAATGADSTGGVIPVAEIAATTVQSPSTAPLSWRARAHRDGSPRPGRRTSLRGPSAGHRAARLRR
jgi:hypothetical protein